MKACIFKMERLSLQRLYYEAINPRLYLSKKVEYYIKQDICYTNLRLNFAAL
jgi:hypothetical protein